jgi:hypothetical protein
MTSEKVTFTQVEHAILDAIREDNAVALKQFYITFEKIFVDVAINKKLIIKSFNAQAIKCFSFLIDNVGYNRKASEIETIKSYITKKVESNNQKIVSLKVLPVTRTIAELEMLEKIDSVEVREHIFSLLGMGLIPWLTPYVFDLFLQSKKTTPFEQLSFASCEDEKEMCLKLLSGEVRANT